MSFNTALSILYYLTPTVGRRMFNNENHREAHQLLPGEPERAGGPHGAPAVLRQPLGDGVRNTGCPGCCATRCV